MMILVFLLNLGVLSVGSYELPKYIGKKKRFILEILLLAINVVIMLYQIYLLIVKNLQRKIYPILLHQQLEEMQWIQH